MPDVEIINKYLKAGWVKRFLTPETQSWKTIPLSLLQAVGGSLLFKCNFSLKTLPDLPFLPQFYKDVLAAWDEIVSHTPKKLVAILLRREKKKKTSFAEQSCTFLLLWRKICLL